MTHLWHPRTGSTAFLPHLATTTELWIIDLVAQHDPQPDREFASCGDSGFTQSLRCQFAPVKALQLRVSAYRVYGRLAPEKTQQRITLLAQPTQPLPTSTRAFTRNHSYITRYRFAVSEPRRVT